MDANIKARWLTALRSDQYQQTTGWLNKEDGYCCLGVLCELAVEDGVVTKSLNPDYSDETYRFVAIGDELDSNGKVLPEVVVEWAGLSNESPEVITDADFHDGLGVREHNTSLAELNDVAGWDFHQIANLIEDKF